MSTSLSDFLTKVQNNNNIYSYSYKKKVREKNFDVEGFENKLEKLTNQINKLKRYDPENVVRSSTKKQIVSVVKCLNDVKKSIKPINDKTLNKKFEEIDKLFSDNTTDLRKLGIRKDEKKWIFNEESFDKLENVDFKRICKRLFVGNSSFISQVGKVVKQSGKIAQDYEYTAGIRQITNNNKYEVNEINTVKQISGLKNSVSAITNYLGNNTTYNINKFKELRQCFISEYNSLLDIYDEGIHANAIKELTKNTSAELKKIGIEVENDNKMDLSSNAEFIPFDDVISGMKNLFDKNSLYSQNLLKITNEAINDILKVEKIGITLDESI